jgi:hypothetical protein
MQQLILDNQNFIYYLFNITAGSLVGLSYVTGLSYQLWNILIWFGLIPGLWIYMAGKKTTPWLNLLTAALFLYLFWVATWNVWFNQAVVLLNYLGKLFGPDYREMSVYVCLFLPALVTGVLAYFTISPTAQRRAGVAVGVLTGLILLGYVASNALLSQPKYSGQLEAYGKVYERTVQNQSFSE